MPLKKEGTYYERNRDHLLKYQMDRRDASTTEQKAKRKQYHDEYYQARKEEINAKRRARTAERNIKKLASKEMSEAEVKVEVEKVIEEKKKKKEKKEKKTVGNASKLPRPYLVTSKDADVFGVSTRAFHQKKELFKNCPQGYFQRPESEDPFKVSFS